MKENKRKGVMRRIASFNHSDLRSIASMDAICMNIIMEDNKISFDTELKEQADEKAHIVIPPHPEGCSKLIEDPESFEAPVVAPESLSDLIAGEVQGQLRNMRPQLIAEMEAQIRSVRADLHI